MNNWIRSLSATTILTIALLPAIARADVSMSVVPKLVTLSSSNRVATITLQNESTDSTLFQVFTLAWSQDGKNELTKTADLVAMPRVFYLDGGGTQTIRIAMNANPDPLRERAYRVIVRSVPTKLGPMHLGLRISAAFALPTYIEPDAPLVAAKLKWSMQPAGQSAVRITVENVGEKRAIVTQLRLTDESGRQLKGPNIPIVLSGQRMSEIYALPSHDSRHINVSARVDGAPLRDEVAVGIP